MSNPTGGLHPQISEAAFQARVIDLCAWLRLRWHHETDSRRSRAGFPDLVICGPGGVLFAELKKRAGRMTPEQADWLSDLRAAGSTAVLWRPEDWPEIEATLRRLAQPAAPPVYDERRP